MKLKLLNLLSSLFTVISLVSGAAYLSIFRTGYFIEKKKSNKG